jgi:hypothetical protein
VPNIYSIGDGHATIVLHESDGIDWSPISHYFSQELASTPIRQGVGRIVVSADGGTGHHQGRTYGVSGGIDNGHFVVPDGAGHWCQMEPARLRVDPRLKVSLNLCCSQFRATVLLDWLIVPLAHFILAAHGCAPLHASGAVIPSLQGPVVFSAWAGVGKTNMVLSALGRSGAFYGDDQVIITNAGDIYPSARRVSVYGYNREFALHLRRRAKAKLRVGDSLHFVARRSKGRAGFLLGYAANGVGSSRASATELGGRPGTTTAVMSHMVCHSSSPHSSPTLIPIEKDVRALRSLAAAHVAVMSYEYVWFRRFLQTWQWSMVGSDDPWVQLQNQWIENIWNYFKAVPDLASLSIPRGGAADPEALWRLVADHSVLMRSKV